MTRQLYRIQLHGLLGKKFGREYLEVWATDIRDAFAGLVARFGDKFKYIILEGAWHIVSGKLKGTRLSKKDNFLSEELLDFPLQSNELHVFPAITGAGGKGVGQIILGVVLIVAAVVLTVFFPPAAGAAAGMIGGMAYSGTAASLAMAGVMSIAGGVMAMMTKAPTMADYASAAPAEQRPSFLFNGTINNTEQGVPVPLVYGEHLTGSTIISAGMAVERI